MVRSLLVRGMLVGLAAGLLAFVVAFIFGEPQVQKAIDFEEYLARLNHEPAEAELVSRGVQRTLGLLTGTVVMGVALGGLFALAFAWVYGRVGALGVRATSGLLALGAFVTITVVPFTKYPANPPAVGNPDTIDKRTILYLAMIAISVLAAIAAMRIRRDLLPRLGGWNATLLAVAAYVVVVALAQLILPVVHETPQGFPAEVLYRFRLASLGIDATLWATIGLGFGALAQRVIAPSPRAVAIPA
jgi:pimeloyl-ACP methyl ester carboxylesterase